MRRFNSMLVVLFLVSGLVTVPAFAAPGGNKGGGGSSGVDFDTLESAQMEARDEERGGGATVDTEPVSDGFASGVLIYSVDVTAAPDGGGRCLVTVEANKTNGVSVDKTVVLALSGANPGASASVSHEFNPPILVAWDTGNVEGAERLDLRLVVLNNANTGTSYCDGAASVRYGPAPSG